jgi:multicomponent Na+:H+ antiporter subunit E
MSEKSGRRPERVRSMVAPRLISFAMLFLLLWGALAGGRGWGVGIPAAVLAAVVACLITPVSRCSLVGLARFIPFFIYNSLRGGIDVAYRVLHPKLPIEPALVRYELGLNHVAARVLMANTVTLLPGTLSAGLDDDVLVIHVLNAATPTVKALETLEQRIAEVFPPDARALQP